jgi:hypothetical protein
MASIEHLEAYVWNQLLRDPRVLSVEETVRALTRTPRIPPVTGLALLLCVTVPLTNSVGPSHMHSPGVKGSTPMSQTRAQRREHGRVREYPAQRGLRVLARAQALPCIFCIASTCAAKAGDVATTAMWALYAG